VVGYLAEDDDESKKDFAAAADHADMEETKFAYVIGGARTGEVDLHIKGAGAVKYPEADLDNLAQWVFEASFPLVDEVGGHNFAKYAKRNKPLHLVFVEPTDPAKPQLLEDLRAVAAEHRDESFSWIDAVKYKAQVKGMGASGDVVPCIIRLSGFGSDNKPVVFEKTLNLESLRDWAAGVKSGKYVYVPKSEPLPESNDGGVKIVVGKNFNEIVNNPASDVLVEYYAPWCGHCKSLAPKWDQLGEAFKDIPQITIAKIDATANDVDSKFEVKGFPTILLYKANDKDHPVAYNGAREVAELTQFLKAETTTTWDKTEV